MVPPDYFQVTWYLICLSNKYTRNYSGRQYFLERRN